MTELALVRIEDNEILVTRIQEGKGSVSVPGGSRLVSPPILGWQGGGEIITTEGPAKYKLVEFVRAVAPAGKRAVQGTRAYVLDGDVVRETSEFEDIPPPPPAPTRAEKLAMLASDYGLTLDDLKAEIRSGETKTVEPVAR